MDKFKFWPEKDRIGAEFKGVFLGARHQTRRCIID